MADNETIEEVEETLEQIEEIAEKKELKIDLRIDEKKTQEAIKKLEETFASVRSSMENAVSGLKKQLAA